jgi:hypothetical protein
MMQLRPEIMVRHSVRKRCPLHGIDFEKMKPTSFA